MGIKKKEEEFFAVKINQLKGVTGTRGSKSQARLSLRRIFAGFKGQNTLPKRVPKTFGRVVKIKRPTRRKR